MYLPQILNSGRSDADEAYPFPDGGDRRGPPNELLDVPSWLVYNSCIIFIPIDTSGSIVGILGK